MVRNDATIPKRARAAERDSLAQVLDLVRSGVAHTRHDIEEASGLGRAVVADRLATLVDRGLLAEDGVRPSTGGRAPRDIRFNSRAGYVLVSSLGTTTLGVGLADLSGQLLVEHHEPADITRGAEAIVDQVDAIFDWMLDEHPAARTAWAVTFAVPALVGPAGGVTGSKVDLDLLPGWAGFPVYDHLASRYKAPVLIGNEAQLMALGELRAGRGLGGGDLIFVKIGTSVSVGLCISGRVHRGTSGLAGDIGHVVVEDNDVICRCGNTGCLEALAGGAAIARQGDEAARDGRSPVLAGVLDSEGVVTAAHVGAAANGGDPFSVSLITRCGQLVGETLATLIAGINPSLVVVGGGVAQSGSVLVAAVRDGIYRRSRSLATQNLPLVRAELGKTAALVGGALAALDDLFDREYLASWVEYGSPEVRAAPDAAPPLARVGRRAAGSGEARPTRRTRARTAPRNRRGSSSGTERG